MNDRPIAGAGFALMAWKLAGSRVNWSFAGLHPAERHVVDASPPGCYPRAREYYRIIDDAAWSFRYAPGITYRL